MQRRAREPLDGTKHSPCSGRWLKIGPRNATVWPCHGIFVGARLAEVGGSTLKDSSLSTLLVPSEHRPLPLPTAACHPGLLKSRPKRALRLSENRRSHCQDGCRCTVIPWALIASVSANESSSSGSTFRPTSWLSSRRCCRRFPFFVSPAAKDGSLSNFR